MAAWPKSDIVVGNPPFIGNKRMREALGDGYVEALRKSYTHVPDSSDLVMFWWDHAAQLLAQGKIQRFGFIATNSLTQAFNRRVLENHLGEKMHLAFAIPDHPWVDNADGAAVRISMTVAVPGAGEGKLQTVISEVLNPKGGVVDVTLSEKNGVIHADLTTGANVASAVPLKANEGLSNRGMIPHGEGFLVPPEKSADLDGGALLKPYRNGKDLTDRPRGVMVIDTFGLTEESLREKFPQSWQWLHDHVKPERDQNKRPAIRDRWWLFGEQRKVLRAAHEDLSRYIATGQTAKHRVFQFLDASILPDDKLIAIALDDAFALGVLSSGIHITWALASGAMLEDRPVYNKTSCFEAFPFPAVTPEQQAKIGKLAEELDQHRKKVLAAHDALTLTGLYNVLVKLRSGEALNAKEKSIHQLGQVAILQSLHEKLDAAVLEAYGWTDKPSDEVILERLVALNALRAKEEAEGTIRWLRPDFQCPQPADPETPAVDADASQPEKQPWPDSDPERFTAIIALLNKWETPLRTDDIGEIFSAPEAEVLRVLNTLVAIGQAQKNEQGQFLKMAR